MVRVHENDAGYKEVRQLHMIQCMLIVSIFTWLAMFID
jgi:hypothetical protein